MSASVPVTSADEIVVGCVKWFNNKEGFGFITITKGELIGTDIFVHHSAIQVGTEQYKYLTRGEYVEMQLVKTTSGEHEYQAGNVTGREGGKLRCEWLHEERLSRNNYRDARGDQENSEPVKMPRSARVPAPRVRGQGPRDMAPTSSSSEPISSDSGEWTYAKKARGESSEQQRQPRTVPKESVIEEPRPVVKSTRGRGRPSNARQGV